MRRTRVADERGAATAELVIATPAMLFLLLVVVHVALWFHAFHVATSVAQEGARVAREQGGTQPEAEAAANQLLDQLGARLVIDPHVQVDYTADHRTAYAVVTGWGPTVVPGLRLPIHAESRGPVESFRSPVDP